MIDRIARAGNPKAIRFPRTWLDKPELNFSFSGLKTAVLYHVYGSGRKYGSAKHLSESELADVAAGFQAALIEPLIKKTIAAARQQQVKNVVFIEVSQDSSSQIARDFLGNLLCESGSARLGILACI